MSFLISDLDELLENERIIQRENQSVEGRHQDDVLSPLDELLQRLELESDIENLELSESDSD